MALYFLLYFYLEFELCEAKKNVAVIFHLKIQIEYNQYYLSETIIQWNCYIPPYISYEFSSFQQQFKPQYDDDIRL